MQKRFTEEQFIRILRDADVQSAGVEDLCRKHRVVEQTVWRRRSKCGGQDWSI